MTPHKISWLNMPGYKPETWNPIVGCTKVSPGCDNCYAERMAIRLAGMPDAQLSSDYKSVLMPGNDNKFTGWSGHTIFREEYLIRPKYWKTPRMVFVCSMGDLFHESVSFETIEQVYDAMYSNKQHIFIVLTKRPERAYRFWIWLLDKLAGLGIQDITPQPKDNIWFGATVENQEQANKRIPILLQIPHFKRFVSIAPMLDPIDFYDININGEFYHTLKGFGDISGGDFGKFNGPKLDWVICGGESGSKARPMHPDWVRSLRDQCKEAGTPFFFKQWGEWMPTSRPLTSSEINVLPRYYASTGKFLQITEPWCEYYKAGKLKSGDKLDGQQHHEWQKINL